VDSELNQQRSLSAVDEVSIIPFKFKYLGILHDILKSNDYLHISTVNMKTLPKIGYIALLGGHPIAAGFLRRVEGGYAQLDTLTSNKYFGSQVRHQGIKKVVDALLQDAKDLKLHGIIAFTEDSGVLSRAKELDFKELPHKLIGLKLGQKP
jgi:hypothetical protein